MPTPTIKKLVDDLRPREEEMRVLGDTPIAVCGIVGGVFAADLSIRLSLSRLSAPARTAAIDLLDSGCIVADERGALRLARLPSNVTERRLLREALGLQHQRGDR